ncbi:hypothetical protein GGX14DRAFT_580946 [Mycena pura]|uniref:Uncharacterized protein n=1 Tax=Mycena pura TaxID=153505 RepID=A0AAD6ULM7_9AGAR|nr:hypothetical protein GGX14DRAFT_580946 [Mycena pura]
MPAKARHLRNRADNFLKGVKRVIQSLSPRKRRKVYDDEKENVRDLTLHEYYELKQLRAQAETCTAPSDVLMNASDIELKRPDVLMNASDIDLTRPDEDVFMSASAPSPLPPGHYPVPFGSYFYQSSRPEVPTEAPDHFYGQLEYTLPAPKSRHATVEEVPDEDDMSYLASRHARRSSVTSICSLDSDYESVNHDPETEAFEKAAASDPQAQDEYANIFEPFCAPGKLREAPSVEVAATAVTDLKAILRGDSRGKAGGYKDPKHDPFVRLRLEGMRTFLNLYVDPRSTTHGHWGASAMQAAVCLGRGSHYCRTVCKLARQFIHDRSLLPINPYGNWKDTMLLDEDLAVDINLYLQELGKDITADKLRLFLARPEVMEKHGITKTISVRTARRYLHTLGYRFTSPKKGQYSDGHEREDVVYERDVKYIPAYKQFQKRALRYGRNGLVEYGPCEKTGVGRRVIFWYHDESIFYAHDRSRKSWYHKDAPAKPYAKGEGHSLMVSDFVSSDFGWSPTSLDGTRSARRFLKPGKNREGYLTCADILEQATEMMDILTEVYPADFEHVFIYDNATIHKKRADGALSARKMPKFTPKEGNNWFVEVNVLDADGNTIPAPPQPGIADAAPDAAETLTPPDDTPSEPPRKRRGKKKAALAKGKKKKAKAAKESDPSCKKKTKKPVRILKQKIRMQDGEFNGQPQSLYFPEGHERAGVFKGMQVILEERGFADAGSKLAECKNFKCAPPKLDCCCRRILFNQPDFANVESLLETHCKQRGFPILFLPKFHCELNFIEQCWGYAKRVYRYFPESSRQDDLERNVREALAAVPLDMMRRFARRCEKFVDAYQKGLNGRQAAWAARKYRGHRVLPENILEELEEAGIL